MIKLYDGGAWLVNGTEIVADNHDAAAVLASMAGSNVPSKEDAAKQTMAYDILKNHNTSDSMEKLKIRFDKLTSPNISTLKSCPAKTPEIKRIDVPEFPISSLF